jgi:hypothetical protein
MVWINAVEDPETDIGFEYLISFNKLGAIFTLKIT